MSKEKTATGVYQLNNGNWAYRFVLTKDGKRKEHKRVKDEKGNPFTTERQAVRARELAIRAALLSQVKPPESKKIEKRKVQEVFEEYCEVGRKEKAYTTKRKQDSLWRNYILDRFGDRYVDEITVAEVNDYLAELYSDYGLAYGYVEAFLKQFYLIFGQAYSRDYLDTDTYNKLCVLKNTKIKMPPMKSTDKKEIEAFTKEEFVILDKYFRGKPVETAYMIGKYTGLRVSECYGLTWDKIDFEKGIIYVEQQMQRQDGLTKLLPLKTKNAKRKVYMCSTLYNYLLELRRKVDEYDILYKYQREQNEIFICDINGDMISSLMLVNTLPNGRIQTEYAIKHHSRPIKEKYNIYFHFHKLRHTYGTNLALMNTPEHILLRQMGHSKCQTTHKYYLAVSEEGVQELKKNLECM